MVDPLNPTGTAAQNATTSVPPSNHAELSDFNGTWIAIQAKDDRQVVHSICGTKAKTLQIGEIISVETAFEKSEQSVSAVTKENSGLVTVTLADDSTLKLSQTAGVLTATGWSNDNMRYIKESTAQSLERIAIYTDGCPTQANTSSSAYQALLGEWIPGNEYKCAAAVYTLSPNQVTKSGKALTIEDISNTDPLWLTVKDSEGVRSGIQLTSNSGNLVLLDGSDSWQAQRLKKNCDRLPTPTGPKKNSSTWIAGSMPKARGR